MLSNEQLSWAIINKSDAATSVLVAAPGVGKRIVVRDVSISTAADQQITLEDSAGADIIGPFELLAAGSNNIVNFKTKTPVTNALALHWLRGQAIATTIILGYTIEPIPTRTP